jgi:hypothetical protein
MISQSRKVLVLLSKGYVTNEWCREEFDHACRHVQQHNEKDLVIVLLHDRNVHKAMDTLTSPASLSSLCFSEATTNMMMIVFKTTTFNMGMMVFKATVHVAASSTLMA